MKLKLFYICILLFYSCNKSNISVLENCSYQEVLEISKEQSKPIFMILGGGNGCRTCNIILKELRNHKSINKYTDKFIFYRCDVSSFGNDYLLYILLMEGIPNYYIVDLNGDIVSYAFENLRIKDIEKELENYLASNPTIEITGTANPSVTPQNMLKMRNLLLKANLNLNEKDTSKVDLIKSLDLIQKSINIYPFFYNLYLESKVYRALNETPKADSCAMLALKCVNNEFHSLVYESLIEEIKKNDSKYVQNKKNLAVIHFDKKKIECGKVKHKEKYRYELEYTNLGKSPLVVTHVSTFCDCLTFDWRREPVLPGGKGKIIFNYTANDKGYFNRVVTVQSNASNSYEKINIEGKQYYLNK